MSWAIVPEAKWTTAHYFVSMLESNGMQTRCGLRAIHVDDLKAPGDAKRCGKCERP